MSTTPNDEKFDYPASPVVDELKGSDLSHADEGYQTYVTTADTVPVDEEESKRIARMLDWRLLPLMCVLYGLCYVDKTAMSWAVLFNFREDLKLKGDDYSWASSIFCHGYLGGQYPAAWLNARFPTAKLIACATICWGSLMIAHIGCRSYGALITVRFLLGVAEAPIVPTFVNYTSVWYTRKEQVFRSLIWGAMQGSFYIIFTLASYGLGHITGTKIESWAYIFLVLGLLSILTGIGWMFMPEVPTKAKFLTEEQKIIAVRRVAENMTGTKGHTWQNYQIKHAFTDPMAWTIWIYCFIAMVPNGGLTSFNQLVIKGFGFTTFQTLLVGMPQSIVSSGSMVVWSVNGAVLTSLPGIATVYATEDGNYSKWGRVVAYWLINSYAVTWPFTLTVLGQNFAGHTKRAVVYAILMCCNAAGNISGPFMFPDSDAPRYTKALTIILCMFCAQFAIGVFMRLYMARFNVHRDHKYGKVTGSTDLTFQGAKAGLLDKTDQENKEFRYVL
uniref:Major facilitator superfamily (MFS) profile domain-containing protein n=1 Tax=Schizophyllum commune (strain H4-8 / FGSC 9210) TaxID=578458 RepID=D8QEL6_SCHCM